MSLSQSLSLRRSPLTAAALVLAALLVLLLPAAGRAAVPITDMYAGPITAASGCEPDGTGVVPSTQAGSRSDFCVAFALNSPPPTQSDQGDDLDRMVVDTPFGFAGDPTGRPVCTDDEFGATTYAVATCPAGSQVGTAVTDLRVLYTGNTPVKLFNVPGKAFVLNAAPTEVARIGLSLQPVGNVPPIKVLIKVTLRPAPNVGLRSTIEGLPRAICAAGDTPPCAKPISLDNFALRFWGSEIDHPTMPKPFALLGADCDNDQVTAISATSYDGTPSTGTDSYRLTDCATVPFSPSLELTTDERRPDVNTSATVTAKFGVGTAERFAASPQKAVVTLPDGLMLSAQIASGAGGLPVCSAEAFALTSAVAAECPEASAVGTVDITSPVLTEHLKGRAYVGAQSAVGALPDLYIEAALGNDPNAPRVKLVGKLSVSDDHRLVTVLDDLPQVPVSEFELTFRGGAQSALVTPPTCRDGQATIVATPRGGAAPTTAQAPYSIDQDCGAAGGFSPSVAFASADGQAGGTGTFTTTISRPDRSQRIARTVIDLPPGQVANLKGVPECPQDVAARGACDPATRVGGVTALAGVGPAPYRISGSVYLTARSDGAVAGISIHVPVVLGGVDLGSLDVPARIEIRPEDLGLRIRADVPERFRGLPLDLRELNVALDRQAFPRNPTSCDLLQSTSQLTGTAGATAAVTAGYQMQNCSRLPFAPSITAAVTGQTKANGRPNLAVRIASADGAAALKRAAVTLPAGVGVDLKQLPRACPQDTFRAGGCPATAKIGTVSGTLAITDEPLGGTIYLLKPAAGAVLPGLGLDFTGRFAGRVVGSNGVDAKTGRIISRFDPIPDLPLTALQVDLAGGESGILIATEELCSSTVAFDATLDGQNGARVQRSATNACNAPLGTRLTKLSGRMSGLRKGKPVLRLKGTGEADRLLKRVDLTLPSGWSLASQRGKRGSKYAKVSGLSLRASASAKRLSSRRLRLTMPTKGSSKFSLLTRTGTIAVRSSSKRKTKAKVAITAKLVYRDGTSITIPLRLTPR
jgi:hypothetical protein